LDKEPVSSLCDELGLQPTVLYRWQKEFFENGPAAFQHKSRPNGQAEQERIGYRISSKSILGGLHHDYRLEKEAA
jgi:transposase-like protein